MSNIFYMSYKNLSKIPAIPTYPIAIRPYRYFRYRYSVQPFPQGLWTATSSPKQKILHLWTKSNKMAISKFWLDDFGGREPSESGDSCPPVFWSLKQGTSKLNFRSNNFLRDDFCSWNLLQVKFSLILHNTHGDFIFCGISFFFKALFFLRDFIFFLRKGVFLREPLYSKDFMSILRFERDIPIQSTSLDVQTMKPFLIFWIG